MRDAQQNVIGLLIGMLLAVIGMMLIPQLRKLGPSDGAKPLQNVMGVARRRTSKIAPENTPLGGAKPLQNVTVVAHRGASKIAPENTMAAFQKALAFGAKGIECDVLFTRDNVPVVSHDDDVSRHVPPQQRPAVLSEMNLAEVKKLDVGSWFSPEYKGQTIPTLRETLRFLKGRIERLYLHDKVSNDYSGAKERRLLNFVNEIRQAGMTSVVVVWAESGFESKWRQHAPDISLMRWNEGVPSDVSACELAFASGFRQFGVNYDDDDEEEDEDDEDEDETITDRDVDDLDLSRYWPDKQLVQFYRDRGCDFTVFTVNDAVSMRAYIQLGFTGIGTDDPELLVSILSRISPAHDEVAQPESGTNKP